jgi:pimeloyl-ACP methyl ester carboxylesterase
MGCAADRVVAAMSIIIGYARVSTDGQSLESQQSALTAAGAERVFAEKVSGAVTDRKALARAIAELGPGDCLLVTRLDRLARSTRDLLNVLDAVAKAGAGFRSLADSWADTTTPHGRLMLTVLGGLAEFERSLILARTSEGRTSRDWIIQMMLKTSLKATYECTRAMGAADFRAEMAHITLPALVIHGDKTHPRRSNAAGGRGCAREQRV